MAGAYGIVPAMGNNLRKLREERGWTHQKAADEMGVSRGQYIKLERGERRLTADYINMAARGFEVLQSNVIDQTTAPLVGYVGAGAEAHYYGDGQDLGDEVPMPIDGTANTVAVRIKGTSMGPLLDGWIVYYDDVRNPPTTDLIGRLCVVGRRLD